MINFIKRSNYILGIFSIVIALFVLQTFTTVANAASCQARAAQVASSTGGQLLSVEARGNKCVVKLLVKTGNGPPRRRTVVVAK